MAGARAGTGPACEKLDVSADARNLVENYGAMASNHAARRALEHVAAGDQDGYQRWLKVLRAVDALLDKSSS